MIVPCAARSGPAKIEHLTLAKAVFRAVRLPH
jgi:hypothetical protein